MKLCSGRERLRVDRGGGVWCEYILHKIPCPIMYISTLSQIISLIVICKGIEDPVDDGLGVTVTAARWVESVRRSLCWLSKITRWHFWDS